VEAVAGEICRQAGAALALAADLAHEASMRDAVETLVGAFGGLDVVIANAGFNGVWGSDRRSQTRRTGRDRR
jgi:NAD(P)-dependent dehydrogenase (short-subunit alcohol dehydrogenase family)